MSTPTKPTVFISYSHKDEHWKDLFVPQLRALEQAGRIVVWDDRNIDGGDTWYPEIKAAMEQAAIAVCIISPDFLASDFCVKEEVPFLLQRRERDGMIFIPMLLRPCAWKAFEWLKGIQMLPRDGKSVLVDFRGIEDEIFAEVANVVLKYLDNPSEYQSPIPPPPVWQPPEKIDIDRLPQTGDELFGRQKELQLLDDAWESNETNIVGLVAWGGVGKSTLVNKWLERMQADNYRGARRVYAWSFYSQGTGERVTSADQFINSALNWFGDPEPIAGSPWDKGERLAKLIQGKKTLLVLDGLEPLQSGQALEKGKIKEPALETLLNELARQNGGLCLITTREPITDQDEFAETVIQKNLEQISDEAGRALLRVGGIQGTDAELEQATRDFGNHALAINLLAVYLHDLPGHHVSSASEILDLDISEKEGKHPRRVMAALAKRFDDGAEVELLKMLGLFDRPADKGSLRALRKAPAIPRLSDHIRRLTDAGWLSVVEKLRYYRLVAPKSQHRPDDLDAHPLVREHFGEQLKQNDLDVWRAGNYRLYEHLKRTAKVFPDTLEDMAPLYAAVTHGCEGGRHQEALIQVYWQRIARKGNYFSVKKLGAFGADLSALAGFFETLWVQPVTEIDGEDKAFVLNQAGACLRALGSFLEAVQAVYRALELCVYRENASDTANNLSELYLTIGDLVQAQKYAKQSIELFKPSYNSFQSMYHRTTLADILHQRGLPTEAEAAFIEAEGMQESRTPKLPLLYSVQGFRYCDLLLDQGKYQEVYTRVMQVLEWSTTNEIPLDTGLDNLLLGRLYLIEAQHEGTGGFAQAGNHLNRALNALRQAGMLEQLPRGLLARTELYRMMGELNLAQADLDKAMRISKRGSMGLHEADCHLEYARLCLAQSEKEKAREHWATAKEMIERMGYHRRDKDVKEIEEQLAKM